jgi:hypothetical protein
MLTIDARALLDPPRPFTDDELTELIAKVIDESAAVSGRPRLQPTPPARLGHCWIGPDAVAGLRMN